MKIVHLSCFLDFAICYVVSNEVAYCRYGTRRDLCVYCFTNCKIYCERALMISWYYVTFAEITKPWQKWQYNFAHKSILFLMNWIYSDDICSCAFLFIIVWCKNLKKNKLLSPQSNKNKLLHHRSISLFCPELCLLFLLNFFFLFLVQRLFLRFRTL